MVLSTLRRLSAGGAADGVRLSYAPQNGSVGGLRAAPHAQWSTRLRHVARRRRAVDEAHGGSKTQTPIAVGYGAESVVVASSVGAPPFRPAKIVMLPPVAGMLATAPELLLNT